MAGACDDRGTFSEAMGLALSAVGDALEQAGMASITLALGSHGLKRLMAAVADLEDAKYKLLDVVADVAPGEESVGDGYGAIMRRMAETDDYAFVPAIDQGPYGAEFCRGLGCDWAVYAIMHIDEYGQWGEGDVWRIGKAYPNLETAHAAARWRLGQRGMELIGLG
jgi:hypothetical protein